MDEYTDVCFRQLISMLMGLKYAVDDIDAKDAYATSLILVQSTYDKMQTHVPSEELPPTPADMYDFGE